MALRTRRRIRPARLCLREALFEFAVKYRRISAQGSVEWHPEIAADRKTSPSTKVNPVRASRYGLLPGFGRGRHDVVGARCAAFGELNREKHRSLLTLTVPSP